MSAGPWRRYLCYYCGYVYDEALGDPDGGIPPFTRFDAIPDGWICPECGVTKEDFVLQDF
ncbi:rubredoxin [Sphingobium jiangsuense]|nr:rubredoxin [Sphingobium jiangsuense]GLT01139.1 rubredoxin [Sphingobium jiangsuense]